MMPDLGAMIISPFSTRQLAGPPLTLSQPDRSLPLNRLIASDGAPPGSAPGVTLGGTGDQYSVASGGGSLARAGGWAMASEGSRANIKANVFIVETPKSFVHYTGR